MYHITYKHKYKSILINQLKGVRKGHDLLQLRADNKKHVDLTFINQKLNMAVQMKE